VNLREFITQARDKGWLVTIEDETDPNLEMARILSAHDGAPILFTRVKGSPYPVVAGVCSDRHYFALALDVPPDRLLFTLAEAMAYPVNPPLVADAPCQEVIEPEVYLTALPILRHLPDDAGPYVTAGVCVIKDPDYGRNVAFHRLLRLDERHFAVRLVEGRGTHVCV